MQVISPSPEHTRARSATTNSNTLFAPECRPTPVLVALDKQFYHSDELNLARPNAQRNVNASKRGFVSQTNPSLHREEGTKVFLLPLGLIYVSSHVVTFVSSHLTVWDTHADSARVDL